MPPQQAAFACFWRFAQAARYNATCPSCKYLIRLTEQNTWLRQSREPKKRINDMSRTRKDGEPSSNQSAEKVFTIVEALADSSAPMRLTDIASTVGYNQSTVLRFLSSLIKSGYVAQEPDTQKYYLTYKISRIANKVNAQQNLTRVTHPLLVELSELVGESTCISIEQQMQMVYVDVATGQNQLLLSVQRIGNTCPMHCSGNGKLLLTAYSEQQLEELVAKRGLTRFTENTITDMPSLERELERIRKNGYAIDNEENEPGVRCIAYPIRDYTGRIIAGISVTGPVSRITDAFMAKHMPTIGAFAEAISKHLGYEGS